ncbi:MAG: hypothetical protein NC218_03750 [Acetobacter sp.]|nr:hypothetical protein [Acetobacter sp.]
MSKSQNQSKDTYSIYVSCSNCGFKGTVQIPMGTTVMSHTCPHCGCRTISNYAGSKPEPRMRYVDDIFDPVDRGLRPSKFPWLNTIYSSVSNDTSDHSNNFKLTYTNDDGNEKLSMKLNGKELMDEQTVSALDEKTLDDALDKVLKELGL